MVDWDFVRVFGSMIGVIFAIAGAITGSVWIYTTLQLGQLGAAVLLLLASAAGFGLYLFGAWRSWHQTGEGFFAFIRRRIRE